MHLGEVYDIALVPKNIICKTIDPVEFCAPHSGAGQRNLRLPQHFESRESEMLHGRICYPARHRCYPIAGVTSQRQRAVEKRYRFGASSGCSRSPMMAQCQSRSLWSSQGIDAAGYKKYVEWSTQLSSAGRRKTRQQQLEPRPRPQQLGQRSPPSLVCLRWCQPSTEPTARSWSRTFASFGK